MPLDLQHLMSDTAEARIDYGAAGDITVVYRPGNVTEKTIRELTVLNTADNTSSDTSDGNGTGQALASITAMNTLLLQLLVSWDLTNHDEPIPLTVDGLADVPLSIRGDILRAIFSESRLDPTSAMPTKPASRGTSGRNNAAG